MRCYLIAVCLNSAEDRDGSMSLFKVVEEAQIYPFQPGGVVLPLQAHIYFEALAEEVGRSIDTRIVWVGEGAEFVGEATNPVEFTNRRVRVRSGALGSPPAFGAYHLRVEWRWQGEHEWHREEAAWPFDLREGQPLAIPPA